MALISLPAQITCAFNDVLFSFSKDITQEDDRQIAISSISASFDTLILKKEYFNNVVKFNASYLLQSSFLLQQETIDNGVYYDFMLCLPYILAYSKKRLVDNPDDPTTPMIIEVPMPNEYGCVVNAIAQAGESISFANKKNTLLTFAKELTYYSGYPLQLSFCCKDGENICYNGEFHTFTQTNYKYICSMDITQAGEIGLGQETRTITEYLTDPNGYTLTDPNGTPIILLSYDYQAPTTSILVHEGCIPANPLYIRFINSIAGWEYLMCSVGKREEFDYSTAEVVMPFVEDEENIASVPNYSVISPQVERSITVLFENIDNNKFLLLKELVCSNFIQAYNEANSGWQKIYIKEANISEELDELRQTVEMTFSFADFKLKQ